MKRILPFLMVLITISLNSQIIQNWRQYRPYLLYFDYSHMAIQGSNVYIHSLADLANTSQYAQSITTDGDENWFLTHDQLNLCNECGFASIEESVLSSNGELYAVGQQNAFPFSGRYYSKIDNSGQLVFGNEFITNPWSSGFYGLKLSNDESFLFVSGYEFFAGFETLAPFLYKMSTDGEIVSSRMIGEDFYTLEKFLVNSSNQIFANVSTNDTLRFASFDSELELRWKTEILLPGYGAYGGSQPSYFFSNGDVLYVTLADNINDNNDQLLLLTRINAEGDVVWHTSKSLIESSGYRFLGIDFYVDPLDNIYAYFARILNTNGGGIGIDSSLAPQMARGGKGGETQIRPALLKFNSAGDFQWTYIDNADDPIEFSTVYPGNVVADEEGYSIITSTKRVDFEDVMNYRIIKPNGSSEEHLYVSFAAESSGKGLVYGGNRTFYSHTIGKDPENESQGTWTVTKYHYDITTGFDKKNQESSIKAYPIPSSDFVTITFDANSANSNIRIYDVTGRMVKDSRADKSGSSTISIAELNPGIYFVSIGEKTIHIVVE
jgi:hypothetical protein